MKYWEVIPEKTEQYWLEVKDPDGWYKAEVKWDGCIHFQRFHNSPYPQDPEDKLAIRDYLHICNIDEEIERLKSLREIALKHFGTFG